MNTVYIRTSQHTQVLIPILINFAHHLTIWQHNFFKTNLHSLLQHQHSLLVQPKLHSPAEHRSNTPTPLRTSVTNSNCPIRKFIVDQPLFLPKLVSNVLPFEQHGERTRRRRDQKNKQQWRREVPLEYSMFDPHFTQHFPI